MNTSVVWKAGLSVVAGVVLLGTGANPVRAADDGGGLSVGELCDLGGGTYTDLGGGTWRCCWFNWGCLTCASDNVCAMDCETQRCCRMNNGCLTLDFPEESRLEDTDDPPQQPFLGDLALSGELALSDVPPAGSELGNDAPDGPNTAAMAEILRAVAPDEGGMVDPSETPDDEAAAPVIQRVPGDFCGVVNGGVLLFGFLGLVGMTGRRRHGRA